MNGQELLASALQAHSEGDLVKAGALATKAVQVSPDDPQAVLLLGIVQAKLGDAGATATLERAVALDPDAYQGPFWLSVEYRKTGKTADALERARDAARLNPQNTLVLTQLGVGYLDARHLVEAEKTFVDALRLKPNTPQIRFNLSRCLYLQCRVESAAAELARAVQLLPANAGSYLKAGEPMLADQFPEAAETCARKALAIDANSTEGKTLLVKALIEQGRCDEALSELSDFRPLREVDVLFGRAYQGLGETKAANECFERAWAADQTNAFAFFSLARGQKMAESDRNLLEVAQSRLHSQVLPDQEQSLLAYGLGKAYEDLKDFESAFKYFELANDVEFKRKFKGVDWDKESYAKGIERLKATFSQRAMQAGANSGQHEVQPIIVLGMMRSGTTLTEQILSSHPEIGGAGELSFWFDNWFSAVAKNNSVDPAQVKILSQRYENLLCRKAPGKLYVVDKMPSNYNELGMIHMAFPKAKIIHCTRHPVDNCLSVYITPNRIKVAFAHNRENIVFGYRQYQGLMDHWKAVLPRGAILDVSYEQLVAHPEKVTRQMIEFCGLSWDDACLRPEGNQRVVSTPSVWQVRQPIYTSSTERWRRYERWIPEFLELLPIAEKGV